MQIRVKWHKERMKRLGVKNIYDLRGNILVGVDYLAELLERNADVKWALMAYNGSPSYANEKLRKGIVTNYAKEIISRTMEWEGVKPDAE